MDQPVTRPVVFCFKTQKVLVKITWEPPGPPKLLHQRQLVPFWAMCVTLHSIAGTPDTQQEVPAVVR